MNSDLCPGPPRLPAWPRGLPWEPGSFLGCPCLSPRLLGWRAVPGPLTWGGREARPGIKLGWGRGLCRPPGLRTCGTASECLGFPAGSGGWRLGCGHRGGRAQESTGAPGIPRPSCSCLWLSGEPQWFPLSNGARGPCPSRLCDVAVRPGPLGRGTPASVVQGKGERDHWLHSRQRDRVTVQSKAPGPAAGAGGGGVQPGSSAPWVVTKTPCTGVLSC